MATTYIEPTDYTSIGDIIGSSTDAGLLNLIKNSEDDLKNKIKDVNSLSGSELNQAQLLNIQVAIQGWTISSGMVTGIIRGLGDGLSKVTQNIR